MFNNYLKKNIFAVGFLTDKNDKCYMSKYRKTSADDLYFVTLTIAGWVNLIDIEVY